MPPAKSLFSALSLLCLTLPLAAETPAGSRLTRNDSDSRQNNPSQETTMPIPRTVGGKTYEEWKQDLRHNDPSVRATAISNLPYFREKAMECVPLLIDRMSDKDASPRVKAVMAMQIMGINGAQREHVVKALGTRIANDTQAIVRYEAVKALQRFGPDARAVLRDLVKGIGDSSTWELREACIMGIILAGVDEKKGPDDGVINALLNHTKPVVEPSRQVRLEAIIALGALGRPHSPSKLSQVQLALKDHSNSRDKAIRIWAHVSLMALDDKVDEKQLDKIVEFLNDRERDVRSQAVTALGAMQGKANSHVKDIIKLLQREKEPTVQSAACEALARMGDKSDRVLQALIQLTRLDSTDTAEVVIAACRALAQIHVANAEVLAAMNKAAEHRALNAQQKRMVQGYIDAIKKPLPNAPRPKDKDKGAKK